MDQLSKENIPEEALEAVSGGRRSLNSTGRHPYYISDECVSCDDCADCCPGGCIYYSSSMRRYVVNEETCCECGNCASYCPVGAIYRR